MNTLEKIAVAAFLFAGGVALGMWYEHQRFLAEMQGHVKEHKQAAEVPTPEPPIPEAAA